MSKLGRVVEAVENYNQHSCSTEVKRARTDKKFGQQMVDRWNEIKAQHARLARAPTGLKLPRLALPEIDEPGEIARYLLGEGLPGEFPFLNGAYREMYLEPLAGSRRSRPAATRRTATARSGEERPRRERRANGIVRSSHADGRADASVLRPRCWRKTRTSASIFSARISARSASAPRSTARRSTASTATPTASSARSAKAASPSTPSKTWCGSTTASISARRISPRR